MSPQVDRHLLAGVAPHDLPLALAGLHRETGEDAEVQLAVGVGAELAELVVSGAGFAVIGVEPDPAGAGSFVVARRCWALPDHVGAGMRLLLVGLNPSPAAADAGVGFARPGNRFWPALVASGLATADRDPRDLLARHRIGMTDLVARVTSKASELSNEEFAAGLDRLDRLVGWLAPGAVCFVGLQGWRAAADRGAIPGLQDARIGGRPVYVMPNPSGLNAHHRLEDFVHHFRAAAAVAAR